MSTICFFCFVLGGETAYYLLDNEKIIVKSYLGAVDFNT